MMCAGVASVWVSPPSSCVDLDLSRYCWPMTNLTCNADWGLSIEGSSAGRANQGVAERRRRGKLAGRLLDYAFMRWTALDSFIRLVFPSIVVSGPKLAHGNASNDITRAWAHMWTARSDGMYLRVLALCLYPLPPN